MMFTSGSRTGRWLEISGAGTGASGRGPETSDFDPETHDRISRFGSRAGKRLDDAALRGVDDLRQFFAGDPFGFLRQFN